MSKLKTKTRGLSVLMVITVIFIGLRFVNIESDFPSGITVSSALYTDEGWHLSAAINFIVSGNWYIKGDFNPAVNLPIGHLLQALTFSIFGMNLTVARSTVVFCFTLILFLEFLLVLKYVDRVAAVFAIFFLSVNFFTFAYSRLAILEIVMIAFVLLALSSAGLFMQKRSWIAVPFASFLLVLATLTKTTAISALPALLYLASVRGKTLGRKAVWAGLSVLVFIILLASYNTFASSTYYDDFFYFKNLTVDDRLSGSVLKVIKNFLSSIIQARRIEPLVYLLTVLASIVMWVDSKHVRQNVLVHTSLLWMVSYFCVLSVTSYHPSRYFVPLMVPVSFLFGMAISWLKNRQATRFLPWLVCIFILVVNGYRIIDYVSTPKFTFVEMAQEVQQMMAAQSSSEAHPVLLGNFASSISLATGIRAINTDLSLQPVHWKVLNYRPQFYISLGHEPEVVDVLNQTYQLQKLSEWDVFDNFYDNKKVYLFKLNDR